jgi:hypothetical protein
MEKPAARTDSYGLKTGRRACGWFWTLAGSHFMRMSDLKVADSTN